MIRLLFVVLAIVSSAYAAEPKVDLEDYVYYVYLKSREIIKADMIAKSDDPDMVLLKLSGGAMRKVRSDNIATVKVEKRPAPEAKPNETTAEAVTKTLADVATDPTAYLDKNLKIENAVLTLSTYFNYGYRDARATHISFQIRDRTGAGYVYVSKDWEGAEELRQRVLRDGSVSGKFTMTIFQSRYDGHSSTVLAELTGYTINRN